MNLYEEYGKAVIQAELAQGRVMELKQMIANELEKNRQARMSAMQKPSDKPVAEVKPEAKEKVVKPKAS